jgi:hypothetical protein
MERVGEVPGLKRAQPHTPICNQNRALAAALQQAASRDFGRSLLCPFHDPSPAISPSGPEVCIEFAAGFILAESSPISSDIQRL